MSPNVYTDLHKACTYTKKETKNSKIRYIAVDKDGEIFGYEVKPYRNEFEWFPAPNELQVFIGYYKGKAFWKTSLRDVKHPRKTKIV